MPSLPRPAVLLPSLLLALLFTACAGDDEETVEPLGKLDFRPTSEFGLDAVITGLQLGRQVIDERMPEDGTARAEGYRFLLRQIEMNLANLSNDNDPAHPMMSRCPSKICKLGFDNPDYVYVGAMPLSVKYNYRIWGDRGTAEFFLVQVMERGDAGFKGTSRTDSDSMHFNADGSWELFLGAEKPADVPESNFLRIAEENVNVLFRIGLTDWDNAVEPSINIEMTGPAPGPAEPLTPMRMAVTGFAFSKMLPGQLNRWIDIIEAAPMNGVDQPVQGWASTMSGAESGGFGNYSTGGRYRLAGDEALIIEAPMVPTRYQNIQLGTIWSESLDYATRQTSLNGRQAHLDSDQVHRYVLAHSDPGVPNWLDVGGHPEGAIFMRWVNPGGGQPPAPSAKLVKLDELQHHLPPDTPAVSAGRRAAVLKGRLLAYNRRTNPANISAK